MFQKFVKPASLIGSEAARTAVTYFFGPTGGSLGVQITIEPSQAIEGGVFIRANIMFDAQEVDLEESRNLGLRLLEKSQSEMLAVKLDGFPYRAD